MELFADRFAIDDEGRAVDVATGLRVTIRRSRADAATDVAWNVRCDAFHRLRHPAIAPLVDYGVAGRGERFEAWQCGEAWGGPDRVAADALALARRFLRCADLPSAQTHAVHERAAVAVVIPATDGDEEPSADDDARSLALGERGLVLIERPVTASLAEMFGDVAGPRGHVAALWGPRGSGRTAIAGELARLARLGGLIPVCSRLVTSAYAELWRGRSLFLIQEEVAADVWPAALDAAIRSPLPHAVLIVSGAEVAGVDGLPLARVPLHALVGAIRPRPMTAVMERQVRRAAERSQGWPGRFARSLGVAVVPASTAQRSAARALVAERAAIYGGGERAPETATTHAGVAWPAPGELAALREQIAEATRDLDRGRHERAIRALRYAIGGLGRRGSWTEAAEAGVVLAGALRRRGHVREALAAAGEARDHAARAGSPALALEVAIETGEIHVGAARLDEAEAVLAMAVTSATSLDDRDRLARAALALARCLFWRGRYDEASAAAAKAGAAVGETTDRRRQGLLARIAAARGDVPSALGIVSALSERIAATAPPPRVRSEIDHCAAIVHLAAGDAPAAAARAVAAISASRLARDPLRTIRSRVVLSEAERRRGRPAFAAAQLRRVVQVAGSLPPLVQAEVRLVRLLLTDEGAASGDAATRHIQQCGLPALRLLAPPAGAAASGHPVVDEVIAIVRACQSAEEELVVLKDVCARVRQQLHASAVVFAAGAGRPTVLAGDGARIDLDVAHRAMASGICIQPHRRDDHLVAAAPVQYGGTTVGALAVRWTFGSTYDQSHAAAMLATTAVASAPIVWAAITRRERIVASPARSLLGATSAMDHVRRLIDRAAAAPFPVLIDGESGCGKELVAQAVHRGSPRRDRPFRTLNCAAIPDDLVEAELFGHVRGAFTGAMGDRTGVFEEAHGGTLLLDEVGELTPRAQAKLLRVIQEGEIRRVGENLSRRVDVRIVAATNRDLQAETAAGRFRLDLLYRLDVIRISVPPLRERTDDVPLLVEHYWREATERVHSRATLAAATVGALGRYPWPGNVRELQNVLAALAVRCPKRGVVPPSALPPQFRSSDGGAVWRLEEARRVFEEGFVRAALVRAGGHRARAAAELGVTRQGLTKLMSRLGIDDRA